MKTKVFKNRKRTSIEKVMTGLLVGSLVGATVGWLTAPASGAETRRRLRGDIASARAKARSALDNVESKARELTARQPHPLP
jgi:gas vesicle protein